MAKKVTALAPLLMLIVSLPGQLMLRCRMDGSLRPACCCPAEDGAAETPGPIAREADCCDPVMAAAERPPGEKTNADDPIGARGAMPVPLPAITPIVDRQRFLAANDPDPARDGPPLILLKHTFLI